MPLLNLMFNKLIQYDKYCLQVSGNVNNDFCHSAVVFLFLAMFYFSDFKHQPLWPNL